MYKGSEGGREGILGGERLEVMDDVKGEGGTPVRGDAVLTTATAILHLHVHGSKDLRQCIADT